MLSIVLLALVAHLTAAQLALDTTGVLHVNTFQGGQSDLYIQQSDLVINGSSRVTTLLQQYLSVAQTAQKLRLYNLDRLRYQVLNLPANGPASYDARFFIISGTLYAAVSLYGSPVTIHQYNNATQLFSLFQTIYDQTSALTEELAVFQVGSSTFLTRANSDTAANYPKLYLWNGTAFVVQQAFTNRTLQTMTAVELCTINASTSLLFQTGVGGAIASLFVPASNTFTPFAVNSPLNRTNLVIVDSKCFTIGSTQYLITLSYSSFMLYQWSTASNNFVMIQNQGGIPTNCYGLDVFQAANNGETYLFIAINGNTPILYVWNGVNQFVPQQTLFNYNPNSGLFSAKHFQLNNIDYVIVGDSGAAAVLYRMNTNNNINELDVISLLENNAVYSAIDIALRWDFVNFGGHQWLLGAYQAFGSSHGGAAVVYQLM